MVELETILVIATVLLLTYLAATLPPKLFRRLWRYLSSPYENLPYPALEGFLPMQAQGFFGSSGVSFKPRVKAYEKLPKRTTVFKERYLWYPIVTLCDPKFLGLLESMEKTSEFSKGSELFGEDALIFLSGDRAKRDHTRLAKAFKLKDPQELQKRIFSIMSRTARQFRKRCSDSQFEYGGFSSEEEALHASLEMFCEAICGIRLHDRLPEFQAFLQYLSIGNPSWLGHWGGTKLVKLMNSSAIRVVDGALKTEIERRIQGTMTNSNDMLQLLVDYVVKEEKETIIEGATKTEWVCNQIKGLFFASVMPTAYTMCWALALLALNSKSQERIREELDVTCQEGRPPSYNELQELKFLDAFIKEVLRLFPIAPYLERQFSETAATRDVDGVHIPPTATVRFDIMALHRREDFFSDPNDFLPERWLKEENKDKRNAPTVNHQAYLPFGLGHRTCLGRHVAVQALKVMIATLLRNHQIVPLDAKQGLPDANLTKGVLTCFPGYDVQLIGRHEQVLPGGAIGPIRGVAGQPVVEETDEDDDGNVST